MNAGYPGNTDLILEEGKPVLKCRKGTEQRPSALALEQAIHQRLPERSLLDILTRAAYLTCWHRHLGPGSGSDPTIDGDELGRYCSSPRPMARTSVPPRSPAHARPGFRAHLYTAGNKHTTATTVHHCSADVINAFTMLDVAGVWGDGQIVAVDGLAHGTWENNLPADPTSAMAATAGWPCGSFATPTSRCSATLCLRGVGSRLQRRVAELLPPRPRRPALNKSGQTIRAYRGDLTPSAKTHLPPVATPARGPFQANSVPTRTTHPPHSRTNMV